MRDIEIYLPCDPDWFCDGLLNVFIILFIIGVILFVVLILREYRNLYFRKKNTKTASRTGLRKKHHKDKLGN